VEIITRIGHLTIATFDVQNTMAARLLGPATLEVSPSLGIEETTVRRRFQQ